MKKNYTISISAGRFWVLYLPAAVIFFAAGGTAGLFIVDRLVMPQIIGVSGRDVLDVPEIVKMPSEEARQKLYDIGLRLQVVGNDYSSSFPQGTIISQQPVSGEKVKKGRHVCVTVSNGDEVARIPLVKKMSERAARTALRDAGFDNIQTKKNYHEEIPVDAVINADPPSGVKTSREVPVTVWVSKGPKPTHAVMPNVVGEMLSEAKVLLEDSGLTLGKVEYRAGAGSNSGMIISQSVSPGNSIPLESAVNLVVAGGK
jgi:serine/threonine-protein kinase